MTGKTGLRYSQNPFIEDMIVPIRDQQVKLSRLGKDDNILINQTTGEVQGTHVTTYRKVDSDKFVKLFAANIAMTFDLNAAGFNPRAPGGARRLTVFKRGLNELVSIHAPRAERDIF